MLLHTHYVLSFTQSHRLHLFLKSLNVLKRSYGKENVLDIKNWQPGLVTRWLLIFLQIHLLTQQSLLKATTGNLIDLISNDVQRIELTSRWIFASFFFALEFTVVIVLLLHLIGWPALMGVLFLVAMILCVLIISYICAGLRVETAEVSDRRLLLMNELVTGIRALKTHAWEEYYQEKVKATRRWEFSIFQLPIVHSVYPPNSA